MSRKEYTKNIQQSRQIDELENIAFLRIVMSKYQGRKCIENV